MTKRKRILLTTGALVAGLLIVLIAAAVITVQTPWFANFVRQKIIATAEDSTGGVVEIGAFKLDLAHFTVRIRNFILHGTEPQGSDPLIRIKLLELRLKLFAGLKKTVDLRYLGIEQPQVNLMLLPDGTTNVPQPKTPQTASQTSGLQTVVDLAVGEFQLNNGQIKVLQQKTALSAHGENLRVLLDYNTLNPSYTGSLAMDPLLLWSGNRPPLNMHLNVPVIIERDAIRVANARLTTNQSQVLVSGSLENMNGPVITARLNAKIALQEIGKSVELPINASAPGAPTQLTAEMAISMNQKTSAVQIQSAHVALGQTTIEASGELNPARASAAQFRANFALAELSHLFGVASVQPSGNLQANGRVALDKQNNYRVDGRLDSRGLSVRSGTTQVSDISLTSPFHADSFLISLDGLNLSAVGGSLSAKVFLEKLQDLSVEGHVRNLSLPVLAATFTGKHLGYDGFLNGVLLARGNLKAKGSTGYSAQTNLVIQPGRNGIPVTGRLNANYAGAKGVLDLGQSYIALPNSRLDLTGSINHRLDLKLASTNLADFLPAVNFGASKPQSSLPVVLQGGTAQLQAEITGNMADPHIGAHVEMNDFAVEQRPFHRLAIDVSASPASAAVRNGMLIGTGLNTAFDGSIGLVKWEPRPASPVTANLILRNGDLADLASLAGQPSMGASGAVTADIHVNGTYGDPLGRATLQVMNGSVYQQPFGKLLADVTLADQLLTLSQLEVDTAGGKITANATFRHPKDSLTVGHAQLALAGNGVQLAQLQALAEQNAGIAGIVQLSAKAAIDVQNVDKETLVTPSMITADFAAHNLRVQNQDAGDLIATARTSNGKVTYDVHSDFAGSNVKVQGETALAKDYRTTADASIANLSIAKALQIVGQGSLPASGNFSAKAHVDGPLQTPNANLDFALLKARVYQEPVDSLKGSVHYAAQLVEIPSIDLQVPAGRITLSGSYDHPVNNFNAGSLKLKLNSTDVQLGEIVHVQQQKPGLDGTLRLAVDLSGNLREEHGKSVMLLSNLTADASLAALHLNRSPLGGLNFTARTAGSNLNFRLDSDIARSQIHGSGQAQLSGDYPLRANVSFSNIRYSNLAPFLATQPEPPPAFEALVEGQASINGPVLDPENLGGRLELSRLDLKTNANSSPTGGPALRTVELQNKGPIVVALSHNRVQLEQLHIAGRETAINVSGSINLKNETDPLDLQIDANMDLGLLQDADRDFYSSGFIGMNASVRGSFAQPRANGEIDLKNANINYADAPNGLSNANGVILLSGTNATIQSLTGESGGGKISATGFVGLGAGTPNFNLQASASSVRVRYSGISATSNATITLTGNLKRSLLAGTVSVERIAYASSSDAGSLLSAASTPPTTPSSPSPLLSGMRLSIHVVTAPDIQVVSTYANRLSVIANLTLRGTAESPGMLGRMTVTDGQLVFFGNTYTVTTGTINFYDPNAITPVLNVSLETVAQGVNVTIGAAGPINDLKLSYRSDPPLTLEQIVQLLATNTTPANPVIAAHQPSPASQSLSQMGESAVLGQAVANPLASRVQRVFGLTQFKIDPSFTGSNGQPSARVTLQQKIASNITFTYITDVTQTNAQIVRVQWDLTSNLSAVALRDFNGNVSVEMFYKFTRR